MRFSGRRQSSPLSFTLPQSQPTGWPAHNLPLKFTFCGASSPMNDDFSFLLSETHRGNRRQLGHSMVVFFFFPREYKSLCFQTRFSQNAFLQNSKFKNSAKHRCIDKSATATFFIYLFFCFAFPLSPFSSSIVTALQKEYEIFIRASCVEGTTSTW